MSPTLAFAAWWLEVGEGLVMLSLLACLAVWIVIGTIWWVRKVWP